MTQNKSPRKASVQKSEPKAKRIDAEEMFSYLENNTITFDDLFEADLSKGDDKTRSRVSAKGDFGGRLGAPTEEEATTAKGGRPRTAGIPEGDVGKLLSVRLATHHFQAVRDLAASAEMTPTEYVRLLILRHLEREPH